MPSFLYPVFLAGLAAAAIPIILHLLRDEQAPELRFSAVRLLRGVRVERARRRHVKDWLLLALRAAALALLALAFARPYLASDRVTQGGATIILLDRSASMAAPAVWSRATAEAARRIDGLPAGEAVGLIAFDDRADLVAEPTFDRGAVKAALGGVRPGVGGTRYGGAVARAVSALDDAAAGRGRVVLVSDLQGTTGDARATIPEGIELEVIAAAAPFDNLALLDARPDEEGIVASVRNDGAEPRRVRVRATAAGQASSESLVDVPPSEHVDVRLRGGPRRGEVRVSLQDAGPDGLPSDNERFLNLDARERTRVLVIGRRQDVFYVDAALNASDRGRDFAIDIVPVGGTVDALRQTPPPSVVFLLGTRGLDRGGREALHRFVQEGGGVLIATADGADGSGVEPLLDGLTVSAPRGDDALLALGSREDHHPLFRAIGAAGDALGGARFTRAWRVRAVGWQPLARFDDGTGALYEKSVGAGRVLFLASDLNRGWNDLPLQTAFVPFVHEVARYLAPEEERLAYTPAMVPGGLPHAIGFVQLESGRRVPVNLDPRESDPSRMDAGQVLGAVRRGGGRAQEALGEARARAAEHGQSLWRYGLILMFVTLVVEGVLGGRVRSV